MLRQRFISSLKIPIGIEDGGFMIKLFLLTIGLVFMISCASESVVKRDVASDEEKAQEENIKKKNYHRYSFPERK